MSQKPCPTSEQFSLFAENKLPAEAAWIQAHLEECAACEQIYAGMTTETILPETPVGPTQIKSAGDDVPSQPDSMEGFKDLMADLRKIPERFKQQEPVDQSKKSPMIGPYKLLQRIGQGGMGEVYMAEQTEPVRRKVALKLIKSGMNPKEVIARFEAERQALAMMDHQHIAKVLDAGTTD